MPPSPPLSLEIQDMVRQLFADEDARVVNSLLLTYGEQTYEREVERVRRGILSICAGQLNNVRYLVWMAKKDYRDLIVAAEYVKKPPQL